MHLRQVLHLPDIIDRLLNHTLYYVRDLVSIGLSVDVAVSFQDIIILTGQEEVKTLGRDTVLGNEFGLGCQSPR